MDFPYIILLLWRQKEYHADEYVMPYIWGQGG